MEATARNFTRHVRRATYPLPSFSFNAEPGPTNRNHRCQGRKIAGVVLDFSLSDGPGVPRHPLRTGTPVLLMLAHMVCFSRYGEVDDIK
jgi:hypothetical protein